MYTLRGVPQTQSPHQSPHTQKKKKEKERKGKEKLETSILIILI